MTAWNVWCDGSCQHGVAQAPRGVGGWGGWCAVVEHGSDGRVVRGRVPDTTNVRMELQAAIEGLRVVPDGETAILYTDCTTLLVVYERWRYGEVRPPGGPDARLWLELDAELDRVRVDLRLLLRGDRDPVHRRCHTIAGAEARGGLRGLSPNSVPLDEFDGDHRVRAGLRRRLTVRVVPDQTCPLCGSVGGHRRWCHRYGRQTARASQPKSGSSPIQ